MIKDALLLLLTIECTFKYPDGTQISPFNLGTIDMESDVGRILKESALEKRRSKRSGKKHINVYTYFVEAAF